MPAKNADSIVLIQGTVKLNIDGMSVRTDEKRGYNSVELITGDLGEQYVSLKKKFTITINQISQFEYNELMQMWSSKSTIELRTERGMRYKVKFLANNFSLNPQQTYDGVTFYNGTIELIE